MRMLNHHKAAYITQHHQDMLIHCVDMKQVMLHLTNDSSEGGQIATEDAGTVHELKSATDSLGLFEDFHKECAVDRIFTPLTIHFLTSVIEGSKDCCR